MALCTNQSNPLPQAETDEWLAAVQAFLKDKLGPSFVARFRDYSGIPASDIYGVDPQHQALWRTIRNRVTRLQEFSAQPLP